MNGLPAMKVAKAAVAVLAVVAAVGVAALTVLIPRVTGSVSLTVLTGSMSPAVPAGSMVLVKPIDPDRVEVGDVITFQKAPGESSYITHRVIDIEDDGNQLSFITKGDANRGADLDPVPAGAVRGRVLFHVPHVGKWGDTVRSPLGALVLIGVPCALYIAFQARELLQQRRQRHGDRPGGGTDSASGERDATIVSSARALLLARVEGGAAVRREFVLLASSFGGSVADVRDDQILLVVAAEPHVLDEAEAQLREHGCSQIRRSPVVSFDDVDLDRHDAAIAPPAEAIDAGLTESLSLAPFTVPVPVRGPSFPCPAFSGEPTIVVASNGAHRVLTDPAVPTPTESTSPYERATLDA
jgi:signal peptidase I